MGGMTNASNTNPPSKTVQGLPEGTLRTTMTHLVEGDRVLVQTVTADVESYWVPAPAKPTKRAVWATVVDTKGMTGILVDVDGESRRTLDYTGHTAITIKDREISEAAPVEKATARESSYVADHDTRMLLATRAMSIGYTNEGAGQLMENAYWVPAYPAPCGDECETHQGMRRYDNGECEACEVERQAAEREAAHPVADAPTSVRVPGSEPQRRAVRLLGEYAASGATPQINGATKRTLIRDGWITVGAATGVITLTGDAVAWLASEHTAEVTATEFRGVTLYSAVCNCGTGHENPRMARRVPWMSAMLTSAEDAVAVALGHGEVSRPRYEAPSVPALAVGDTVTVSGDYTVDGVALVGTVVGVEDGTVAVEHAEGCAPLGYAAHMLALETSSDAARVTAERRDVACEECGIMPHDLDCLTGLRLDTPTPTVGDVAAMTGNPVGWVNGLLTGEPRTFHEDELVQEHAFWETVKVAASLTAEDVAGLPTPESVVAAHNAGVAWSAKGKRRKASSVAVKRQRQLASVR